MITVLFVKDNTDILWRILSPLPPMKNLVYFIYKQMNKQICILVNGWAKKLYICI